MTAPPETGPTGRTRRLPRAPKCGEDSLGAWERGTQERRADQLELGRSRCPARAVLGQELFPEPFRRKKGPGLSCLSNALHKLRAGLARPLPPQRP